MMPQRFLSIIRDEVKKITDVNKTNIKFGVINPEYVSGRPTVIIDGEFSPSSKQYAYLSSYTPTANDRVIIISDVIQGKII